MNCGVSLRNQELWGSWGKGHGEFIRTLSPGMVDRECKGPPPMGGSSDLCSLGDLRQMSGGGQGDQGRRGKETSSQ